MPWPPSQDEVVRWGPLVLAGLAGPITVLAVTSFKVQLSAEELACRKAEATRRIERLQEFVHTLEQIEDPAGDQLGQITFEIMSTKCMELFPLGTGTKALSSGVDWCGMLLLKELRIGTQKTASQTDLEYSDGSKLDKLLTVGMDQLNYLVRESGHPLPKDLETALQKQIKLSSSVHTELKRKDLGKAVKLFLLVKGAWPWIGATGLISVSLSSLSSLTFHYRIEALETFRRDVFSRQSFIQAASAMVIVEFSATLLRVLEFQLTDMGHGIAGRMLQIELFKALMKKDLEWWQTQRDPRKIMSQLFNLAQEASAFLDIPLEWLKRFVNIAVQAALMRQSDCSLLYTMLGVHWLNLLGRKGLSSLHGWLARVATRAVLLPCDSNFTWSYALMPQNVPLYQCFVRDEQECRSFAEYLTAVSGYSNKKETVSELLAPVNCVLSQGTNVAQIVNTGRLVLQGRVGFGQAESFMKYAAAISGDVEKTWAERTKFQSKSSGLAKAYDLITIPPSINPDVGIVPDQAAKGHIVFEDVSFEYPGRHTLVLKGLSVEVPSGQTAGITGPAGCGKSTICLLLERLYDVTSGRILLDGRDIREYNPQWLRRQIATVSQEPQLLPMSIRENLSFGCEHDASLEDIKEACIIANIWETLTDTKKFPEGLQTNIAQLKNVSGGEKQRICIARAILANRPILLLDEATSSLDEESQEKVQEALDRFMHGRTTLVIAHRLSTIRKANKIITLENGIVAEQGSHEELMKNDGLYRKLSNKAMGMEEG